MERGKIMTPYQKRLYEQKTDIKYLSVGNRRSKSKKKPTINTKKKR